MYCKLFHSFILSFIGQTFRSTQSGLVFATKRPQPRNLSLPCHPQTFQQQASGVINIITKCYWRVSNHEKLWEGDKCNLAESEVYLNACCHVSIGLHGLLQEALIHDAVTEVVTGEHLHGAKKIIKETWINIIFLPLCLSQRLATEAEIVLCRCVVNTGFLWCKMK